MVEVVESIFLKPIISHEWCSLLDTKFDSEAMYCSELTILYLIDQVYKPFIIFLSIIFFVYNQ